MASAGDRWTLENDSGLFWAYPGGGSNFSFCTRCGSIAGATDPSPGASYAATDLANASFCIPVHKDCQKQFASGWWGQQYTSTVLSQGTVSSPAHVDIEVTGLLTPIPFHKVAHCPLQWQHYAIWTSWARNSNYSRLVSEAIVCQRMENKSDKNSGNFYFLEVRWYGISAYRCR